MDLGLSVKFLKPAVKLFKLPSKVGSTTVKSWVVPDFSVDVNSNDVALNKEASKTSFSEETGARGHDPKSSGLFIRKSMIWQGDTKTRADGIEATLMTNLSHQITRICGTTEDGRNPEEPGGNFMGCAAEPDGNFIGPELDPTELSDQSVEENNMTTIGKSYGNRKEDMGVIPDLTTKVGNLQREEHGK